MMFGHTKGDAMPKSKVAITIDYELVTRLDEFVVRERFANRSQAIEEAVREKIERLDRNRLARECAKLDAGSEQQLADEGLQLDVAEWPEY
jgi:Arc/MetJ-type ribon-helix-helix transcriptional regulator